METHFQMILDNVPILISLRGLFFRGMEKIAIAGPFNCVCIWLFCFLASLSLLLFL